MALTAASTRSGSLIIEITSLPTLEVITITVFLKSTVLPCNQKNWKLAESKHWLIIGPGSRCSGRHPESAARGWRHPGAPQVRWAPYNLKVLWNWICAPSPSHQTGWRCKVGAYNQILPTSPNSQSPGFWQPHWPKQRPIRLILDYALINFKSTAKRCSPIYIFVSSL